MKISKRDIAAIGSLIGKDYRKPGKPRTTGLTKEKKDRLFEATYQLYKQLEAKKNLKRPGRQYEIGLEVYTKETSSLREQIRQKYHPEMFGSLKECFLRGYFGEGRALGVPKDSPGGKLYREGREQAKKDGFKGTWFFSGGQGRFQQIGSSVQANPSWVADHDIWLAAKAKAPGAPWGVITNLYKQMGGRIFSQKDFASKKVQDTKRKNWKNKMKTAGVDSNITPKRTKNINRILSNFRNAPARGKVPLKRTRRVLTAASKYDIDAGNIQKMNAVMKEHFRKMGVNS